MLNFIARRLLLAVPVLLGVSLLVFLVLYLIPGDPAEILLFGSSPTPHQVEELRQQLGLDQPLPFSSSIFSSASSTATSASPM